MTKMAGPIVGIAFILILATALYAFMLHGELSQEKTAVAVALRSSAEFKREADDANRKIAAVQLALNTCDKQLKDLQSKPAPTPAPVRARKR